MDGREIWKSQPLENKVTTEDIDKLIIEFININKAMPNIINGTFEQLSNLQENPGYVMNNGIYTVLGYLKPKLDINTSKIYLSLE